MEYYGRKVTEIYMDRSLAGTINVCVVGIAKNLDGSYDRMCFSIARFDDWEDANEFYQLKARQLHAERVKPWTYNDVPSQVKCNG